MGDHGHGVQPRAKTTAITRNVTVAFKGVNVVVEIKSGRAWLKVWVDGQVSDKTTAAGRVYAPGDTLTFRAKESVEVRTGKSSATYFTVNGIDLGRMNDVGNPETWLFAPPDEPVADRPPLTTWRPTASRPRTWRAGSNDCASTAG